jgi:hypothetical protein
MPLKTPRRFRTVTAATTTTLAMGGAGRSGRTIHQFFISLTANITTLNVTGMRDGDEIVVLLKQDATGSRTVGFGTMWLFGGGAPTVTATASKSSILRGFYSAATGKIMATSVLNI